MRISSIAFLLLLFLGAITLTTSAHTATLLPGEQPSAEQPRGHTGAKQDTSSWWDQAAAWVWTKQRQFHRALTRELRELRGKEGVGWTLVLMSFLYGL